MLTWSPVRACNWKASTRPSATRMLPGASAEIWPCRMACPSGEPGPWSLASMPRNTAPASVAPFDRSPWTSMKGSALATPASWRARSARSRKAAGSAGAGKVA